MTDSTPIELSPRFAKGGPMRVVGLMERYTGATMQGILLQWERFQQRLPEVQRRTDPAQFGLHYEISLNPLEFEYVTGVMVDDDAPLPAGFVERRPPVRRHAVFATRDGVAGLRPLLPAIFREWLPRSGYEVAGKPLFTEVYGEEFDPVSLGGLVEVWVEVMPIRGSCHCGKIAYSLDAEPTEAMACNCSICRRKGSLLAFATPDKFNLETSRDDITVYTFNQHVIRHQFCKTCGCAPFSEGTAPDGKAMVAINLRCAEGIDLSKVKVTEFDGAKL